MLPRICSNEQALVVNPPGFEVAMEVIGALGTLLRISYSYRQLAIEPVGGLETTSRISYPYRELGTFNYERADSEDRVKGLVPKSFAIMGICLLLVGLIEASKSMRDCPKSVPLALANPTCVYYLYSATGIVAEMPPLATDDLETSPAPSGGFSCRCY